VETKIQTAFQSSLRFLKYVSPFCKNNRSFNEISRDRKAAERCRSSKGTSRESYFGASEATIA
jgi:hypothetical protein